MRRGTILQGIEQEAEFFLGFGRSDLQRTEYLALYIFLVDTDRATAQFPTVQYHIVCLGTATSRIAFQEIFMAVLRRSKRMMAGNPAIFTFIIFKHREIDHPQRFPGIFKQTVSLTEIGITDLVSQCAQCIVDDPCLVRAKENQVAVLRTRTFQNLFDRFIRQVLHDRRLQTGCALADIVDTDIGKSLGTINTDELRIGIDFRTRHAGPFSRTTRNQQCRHTATRHIRRIAEHLERNVLHDIRQFSKFHLHAQIRLVGTVFRHRHFIRHDRERIRQFRTQRRGENMANHVFEEITDFLFFHKRHFAIDLREFRLAIRPQILITETFRDLVITIEPGDHQQLLEKLWRLRQCEKFPRIDA